jgi:hypothetical protein
VLAALLAAAGPADDRGSQSFRGAGDRTGGGAEGAPTVTRAEALTWWRRGYQAGAAATARRERKQATWRAAVAVA